MPIKKYPYIRLLLPFIVGIFTASKVLLPPYLLLGILLSITLVFFVLKILNYKPLFIGITIQLLFFCLGASIFSMKNSYNNNNILNKPTLFKAKIIEIPVEKKNSYKSEIVIEAFKSNNYWQEQNTKIIAYFEKDSTVTRLKSGQSILFKSNLNDLPKNLNTIGFDYSQHLTLKGIQNTVYLKKNDWLLINHDPTGIRSMAFNTRLLILNKFKALKLSNNELGVLSALTVGYKDNLETNIRKAYSGAGAMHVLAVSGLHVGIIYLILNYLLGFLKYFLKKQHLKYLTILFSLWAYAFITGLSPSVLRATVMFSFILFGYILNKKSSIYNSIAGSAFLLLLINPNLLFQVGFQLSYIAVIGIIFFQPKIYNLLTIKYLWVDKLWKLTSVSLAAQLATTPISIFYFHQFPVYFWLSNIIVIAAATILIYLSIILIAFGYIAIISKWLSIIIEKTLWFNNKFIFWINELPGAVIENISISQFQVIVLYLLILFFGIWIINMKKKYLYTLLSTALVFSMSHFYLSINANNQTLLNIFQINRQSAIQFIDGKESIWLTNQVTDSIQLNHLRTASNSYWRLNLENHKSISSLNDTIIHTHNFYYNKGFWQFKNKKGYIVHSNSKLPSIKSNIGLDYIIVTGSPKFKLNDLINLSAQSIIIDGSVPVWKVKDWETSNSYLTSASGAFICYIQ